MFISQLEIPFATKGTSLALFSHTFREKQKTSLISQTGHDLLKVEQVSFVYLL